MAITIPDDHDECPTCGCDMARHIQCMYLCGRYIHPDEDGRILKHETNPWGVRTARGWVCMECIAEDAKRKGAASVDDFVKGVRFAMQRGDL